jgi:hypothetical protein
VRFAYVTSLWVEENQKHMLCEPKTLSTQEMRQRAAKYCSWEIMFLVRTVYTSLSAATPIPLITLPFTPNGPQTHRFAPTTAPAMVTQWGRTPNSRVREVHGRFVLRPGDHASFILKRGILCLTQERS